MNCREYQDNIGAILRAVMPDLLGILVVSIVSWNLTSGLSHFLDIGLYDESAYLSSGVALGVNGLPDAAYAPLYAVWYHVLSLLQPDRVQLYYLNYKILTLLPALLLYLFLRKQGVRTLVCVCAACALVVCKGNFQTWPKVSHFTLCILLGGLTLASLVVKPALNFGVLSLVALVASYARPEYFLAFMVSACLSLCLLFRGSPGKKQLASFAVMTLLAVLLICFMGYPLGGESGRSFVAFSQHFSINWVGWTQSDLHAITDSEQIARKCFGSANTAIQCLFNDPTLVMRHIISNILSLPGRAVEVIILPSRNFSEHLRFSRLLGAYILFICAMGILVFGKLRWSVIKTTLPLVSNQSVALVICVLPPLISSVLIYPRDHYLLLLVVPILAALLVLVRDCSLQPEKNVPFFALLVGVFFLFQTPVLSEPEGNLPVKRAIAFLDSLHINQPVQMLESQGGFHYYLAKNWSRVAEYEKSEPFLDFMSHRHINAIMLSDELRNDTRFKSDSQWQEFVADPATANFLKLDVPDTPWVLFIRKELLHIPGVP